ncbi:MAG TPA: AraC family transcriptional regulator, partial [Thermoanaerobaculia bacterium]
MFNALAGMRDPNGSDVAVDDARGFHGLEMPLRSASGAQAVRVVHGSSQRIEPHRHDWACVTIPVLGRATESWDGGEARMAGPCVVVHPPGAYHADHIGDEGLETVSILFDPRWLTGVGLDFRLDRSRFWIGGPASADARRLVRAWAQHDARDADFLLATATFLHRALRTEPAVPPPWLKAVAAAMDESERVPTATLARQLDPHPAWLARRYRTVVGEGMPETSRRKRVERAVSLLRQTDLPLAEIAAGSGFCDQSQMNRDFRSLLD